MSGNKAIIIITERGNFILLSAPRHKAQGFPSTPFEVTISNQCGLLIEYLSSFVGDRSCSL
jgi:hypothetical protein